MSYYADYTIERTDDPPVWETLSDEKINLAAGTAPVKISSDAPIPDQYHTEYYNSKAAISKLTDGVRASAATCGDDAFFHFTWGVGRTVLFRLGGLSAVSGISIGFLREDATAVKLPRDCCVRLSENGVDWQTVVRERSLCCAHDSYVFNFEKTFTPCRALYVSLEFEVSRHVWIDDISIFGTRTVSADTQHITPDGPKTKEHTRHIDKYPDYSAFLGLHNMLLAYNCVPQEKVGENHLGLADEKQLLPYVAYLDTKGNIKDTLFDSFLFLPYSVYTYSKLYKCADGWKYYVDNVFEKGYNLDALEKAVASTQKALSIKDYCVTVFFSILCSKVHYGEFPEKFGDIDGDGIDEDTDTLEGRKKLLKWIIDVQMQKYSEASHAHLTLGGFYWFEEDINYSDEFELELIAYARDYLHSLGMKFFWIPYYQASGFRDWESNGFDIACMQPNYAFNMSIPKQRLYDNAQISKLFGMCTELEIGGTKPENIENFKNYLDVGAETGYMNTVKMYYQGGIPGEFYHACLSSDPLLRSIYDDLYEFVNEKYVSRAD
ncbi:MAG TPA: DUF4855 domain-containing protein [Bacillota bacterium]|nr:DUF4855 domain-containing protein [Bacillota bacterium]